MKKREFGTTLSESILRSMVTENIEGFIKELEKEEEIPKKILITPFLAEDLQPASYDIHLGEEYISHMTGKREKIDPKTKLIIKPGETVTITSLEYVGLPQNITALITSRTHTVLEGVSQMSTHIDPGFHGKLFQTLTNFGAKDIKLHYKEPIAHLTFFRVNGAAPQKRYKGPRLGQKNLEEDKIIKKMMEEPRGNPLLDPISTLYNLFAVIMTLLSITCAHFTAIRFFPLVPGILITGICILTLALFIIFR